MKKALILLFLMGCNPAGSKLSEADAARQAGQLEDAERLYSEVVTTWPDSAEARAAGPAAAEVRCQRGREAALAAWQEAIDSPRTYCAEMEQTVSDLQTVAYDAYKEYLAAQEMEAAAGAWGGKVDVASYKSKYESADSRHKAAVKRKERCAEVEAEATSYAKQARAAQAQVGDPRETLQQVRYLGNKASPEVVFKEALAASEAAYEACSVKD